jgi:hypothetical protein
MATVSRSKKESKHMAWQCALAFFIASRRVKVRDRTFPSRPPGGGWSVRLTADHPRLRGAHARPKPESTRAKCRPPLAPPFQTGEASRGGRRSSAHRSSFHYSLLVGQAGHHTASPLEKKGGNGRGKPPAWEAGRLPGPPQDAGPLVSKAAWGRAGGRDPPTLSTGEARPGAGLPRGGPRAAVSHGCWRGEQEGLASPARGAWKSRLSRLPHRATSR